MFKICCLSSRRLYKIDLEFLLTFPSQEANSSPFSEQSTQKGWRTEQQSTDPIDLDELSNDIKEFVSKEMTECGGAVPIAAYMHVNSQTPNGSKAELMLAFSSSPDMVFSEVLEGWIKTLQEKLPHKQNSTNDNMAEKRALIAR